MKIYKVGGAVRDRLLQRPFHDTDWVVVGATPQEMTARGFTPACHATPHEWGGWDSVAQIVAGASALSRAMQMESS